MDELHERMVARIRALAVERRIPITHLPDRAGVSRSFFWDVMAGKRSPTVRWLEDIARALDCQVADFIERVDDERPGERRIRRPAKGRPGP